MINLTKVKNFKKLSKLIAVEYNEEYHSLLIEWLRMEIPQSNFLFGIIPMPLWIIAPRFYAHAARLGLYENIAVYLRIIAASNSAPEDREATLNEFYSGLVDSYQNMLINYGVIGALIFSVVFGYVAEGVDVSDDSLDFFGYEAMYTFQHVFYFLIYVCIVLSLAILFQSMVQYKQLMFWMPDITSKMTWIKHFSLLQIVAMGESVQTIVVLAIPFGGVLAVSPLAGLLGLLAVFAFSIFGFVTLVREHSCVRLLWDEAKRITELDAEQV